MKLTMILTAVCIMASGCATVAGYREIMDSWVGSNADNLVMSWGAPTSTFTLSSGSKMFSYVQGGGTQSFTSYNAFTKTAITSSGSVYCKTNFEVDSLNIVKQYNFEGNGCKALAPSQVNQRVPAYSRPGDPEPIRP